MALFYWSTYLETGHATIDAQHKRLFELTNRISEIVDGQGRLPEISSLVQELMDYANTHFCDEESVLAIANLSEPEKQRHIEAHKGFLIKVTQIASLADLSHADAVGEFLKFLVNWLVSHILKMDHQLANALPGKEERHESTSPLSVQEILISALTESERRFRQLAEQAPTMIWFCGLAGSREFINKGWLDFIGLTEAEVSRIGWTALVHPDDQADYESVLQRLLQTLEPGEYEYRIKNPGGDWKWVLERIMPRLDGERCVGLIGVATDITAIKHLNETLERQVAERTNQLEVLVRTDELTGLPNRRAFDEKFAFEFARAERYDRPLSLLYFDVDFFKRVNDSYGHAAGDEVLRKLADRVKNELRSTDFVARIGGEEFVVLLIETTAQHAGTLAEELRCRASSLDFEKVPDRVTISIGITTLGKVDNPEAMLGRADEAMLAAKREGRDRCIFFQPVG